MAACATRMAREAESMKKLVNDFFSHSPTVQTICLDCHFPGERQRPTPIAKDLTTLIQVIFMLPGREACLIRQAAAEVFVRFMGGDLSLIRMCGG